MLYWQWDSSLSIGVDVIDGQHRRIIDYLNELYEAHRDKNREAVGSVIEGLVNYTQTHFAFEEKMMERAGYPLADAHHDVHEAFIRHVAHYVREHEAGKDIARKLLSDLQLWLRTHIKNDDQDFAPYAAKLVKKPWLRVLLSKFFG